MSHLKCEHCGSIFSTAGALKTHTKTAKYCLIKQNVMNVNIICEYCNKSFTQKGSHKTHLASCDGLKLYEMNQKLENLTDKITELEQKKLTDRKEIAKLILKNTKLVNKHSHEISCLKLNHSEEIVKLKEEIAFGKGHLVGYKETKAPVTKIVNNKNCIVNAKIASIPITTIKPFTIEAISELVPQYTYEHFIKKVHGMLEIIVPFTTLNIDGVIERNIVCTDLSRTVCHLLSNDRVWNIDNGLTMSSQIIKVFIPPMKIYFQELNSNFLEVLGKVSAEEGRLQKSDYYEHNKNNMERALEILEDVKAFFYAALLEKSEEHTTLVRQFRDLLKPEIHIKAIKG